MVHRCVEMRGDPCAIVLPSAPAFATSFQNPHAKPKWIAANTSGMRTRPRQALPATEHQTRRQEHRRVQPQAREPRQPRYGTNRLAARRG